MEAWRNSTLKCLQSVDNEILDLLRKCNLLQPLARYQLIEKATADIAIPMDLVEKELANHCRQEKLQSKIDLQNWLEERCLTKDELLHQLSLPIRLSRLASKNFGLRAETRFLQRKEELDEVIYSLVRVKDSGMAYELYLQLEANEASFETLASDHSEGPEQRSGGKVGPGSLKQAHPRLQQLLRTATPGVVQEPILIEQWWVVARLDERQETSFNDAMRQRMANELLQDWLTRETKAVVKSLLSAEDGISMP